MTQPNPSNPKFQEIIKRDYGNVAMHRLGVIYDPCERMINTPRGVPRNDIVLVAKTALELNKLLCQANEDLKLLKTYIINNLNHNDL